MERTLRIWGLVLAGLLVLTGCMSSPFGTPVPIPTLTTPIAVDTITPTATRTPAPTPSPAPTQAEPTPQPTVVLSASIPGPSVNLRASPGTHFEQVGNVRSGAQLTVDGKAPGSDWVHVLTEDGQSGWMAAWLLEFEGDFSALPELEDLDAYLVYGRVVDEQGEPINAVTVEVYQTYQLVEYRFEDQTGEDGAFNIFLPEDLSGIWTVEITDVACASRIMDERCRYPGDFVNFGRDFVRLPHPSPVIFEYRAP
ncbi:MAG TPA: SH3 domain-containing protein [Anaerolineaceae bacterium]|nr:SH3 domain-containing protein [Anaerolineaceae bacterium]